MSVTLLDAAGIEAHGFNGVPVTDALSPIEAQFVADIAVALRDGEVAYIVRPLAHGEHDAAHGDALWAVVPDRLVDDGNLALSKEGHVHTGGNFGADSVAAMLQETAVTVEPCHYCGEDLALDQDGAGWRHVGSKPAGCVVGWP